MELIYNSQMPEHKIPFGAVETGTSIEIKIKTTKEDQLHCNLVTYCNEKSHVHPMEIVSEMDYYNIHKVVFEAPEEPCVMFYHIEAVNGWGTLYVGNNPEKLGGESYVYRENPVPFQITVHRKGIQVPEWYKEGIMYQIFVDRFNSAGEDNLYKDRKGFVKYTNWHDKNRYIKDPKGHILYWDIYGGNIKGITEKIDYLKRLNVSVLYLNPIFEANSNHKYDTADYEKLDPGFGKEEDFDDFIKTCKANGINVILDGVFSHVGSDSKYFNRKGAYSTLGAFQSKESPYYEWFDFINYPVDYDSWWKNLSLPNVKEMHPTYLAYIVTGQDSIVKRWLRRGIKGWRLDVADELPDEFIELIHRETKNVDEESIVLGEVWEDASNKVSYGNLRKYFLGNELDSVMNYPFKETFIKFVLGNMDATVVLKNMMSLYENYPREYFYSCMNLIGSHDTVRALTILGEAPAEYKIEDFEAFEYELTVEQHQLAVRRLKILSFLQATFPGIPCIYYGDEVGVQGFRDPYCRKTYPWGKENMVLLDWYRKIFGLRNDLEALKKGDWKPYICKDGVFSFIRVHGNDKLLCVVNASQGTKELQISSKNAYDILNDKPIDNLLKVEAISCHLIRMGDNR